MMNPRSRNALTGGLMAVGFVAMLLLQGCMDQAIGATQDEEKVDPAIPVEAAEVSVVTWRLFIRERQRWKLMRRR